MNTREEKIQAAMEANKGLWDSKYSQDDWNKPVVSYTGERRRRGERGNPAR